MKKLRDCIEKMDWNTLYVGEDDRGGWYFAGNREVYEYIGKIILADYTECIVVRTYAMPETDDGLGIILKDAPFKDAGISSRRMIWDEYEFNKTHHLSVQKQEKGIRSISGMLALRNAIYEVAAKDLVVELVQEDKNHPISRFLLSGSYNLTPEVGEYIISQIKNEIDNAEIFVEDFLKNENESVLVPRDMPTKTIKLVARKRGVKFRWSRRKSRGKLYKHEPKEYWR